MTAPNWADDWMGANSPGEGEEPRRFDFSSMPNEEHGDVDIGQTHCIAKQEWAFDIVFDNEQRFAHPPDRRRANGFVPVLVVCKPEG